MTQQPIAIIGGGPVGLAAAAHLIERGETPLVFEAGEQVGANVRDWGHVRMFSPWEYTVDSASVRLLTASGWQAPPSDALPTGTELLDHYLLPLADLLREYIHTGARVLSVARRDADKMKDRGRSDMPFTLHVAYADGHEALVEARAVIDASGTWNQPNPLGANGLPAIGERTLRDRLTYGIPDVKGADRARYANRHTAVVGSGHSAINALLDLLTLSEDAPDTRVTWVLRGSNLQKVYGGGADDALPARGALGERLRAHVERGAVRIVSPFRVRAVAADGAAFQLTGETDAGSETLTVDEIITATGSRPDTAMLRELRLDLDPSLESSRTLAPMIDPNLHSCGTVPPHGEAELRGPEEGFYVVGMKSYGRAPTFLLATGYEQVRSVAAALVGDMEAARNVQLNLPETGVCSTDFSVDGNACCSPAAPNTASISLGDITVN